MVETAADALLTLCRNVVQKPSNLKYRRVPAFGGAFSARVAACPGALDVLETCGFKLTTYHDGDYYVLHQVNVSLLTAVIRELEIGLETVERVRAKRAAADAASAKASAEEEDLEPFEATAAAGGAVGAAACSWSAEAGAASHARQHPQPADIAAIQGDPEPDAHRQLAARSVVHRVAARELKERQKRARQQRGAAATICAGFVVLAGVAMTFSSAMAVAEEYEDYR